MTTVYYLQWHRSEPEDDSMASDLFHLFHHDPPTKLPKSTFQELYEEVAATPTDELDQVYREWNRGSGWESEEFQSQRYCEKCRSYIQGSEEAVTHAAQNHGYDAFLYNGEPDYIRGVRSMSVGDIIEREGTYFGCEQIGWQEIEIVEGDTA